VGNGNQINIWDDHWIPDNKSRKVFSRKGQSILRIVDELINPITRDWDEGIIRENLLDIDADFFADSS
jgi:hypothetical protein